MKAEELERRAKQVKSRSSRSILLNVASHWRTLADAAEASGNPLNPFQVRVVRTKFAGRGEA